MQKDTLKAASCQTRRVSTCEKLKCREKKKVRLPSTNIREKVHMEGISLM